MGFRGEDGEGEFGEGFGDADDGFELADCDGDAGARVGGDLGGVHLSADGNEVGGEFFAGFGGEAGRAASGCGGIVSIGLGRNGRGCLAYDLQ